MDSLLTELDELVRILCKRENWCSGEGELVCMLYFGSYKREVPQKQDSLLGAGIEVDSELPVSFFLEAVDRRLRERGSLK
jgi:hypothetical protein